MSKKYFVVAVDGSVVTVDRSARKPTYEPHKPYGGVRDCYYDGTDGEDVNFAGGFLEAAIGIRKPGE